MHKRLVLLLAVALALITPTLSSSNSISTLTAKNVEDFVNEHEYALIYAFVDNCESCARFESFMAELAQKIEKLARAKTGKINIRDNMDAQKLLNVTFLPHIALFVHGIYRQYEGNMELDDVYKWVASIVEERPNVIKINTAAERAEFDANTLAVGFKHKDSDTKAANVLKALSKLYPTTKFYRLMDKAAEGITTDFQMTIVRKYDDGTKLLGGDAMPAAKSIQQFFDLFRKPYVLTLDESIVKEIQQTRRPTVFIFDKEYNGEIVKAFGSQLFLYKQKVLLVQSKLSESGSEYISSLFQVREDSLPVIAAIDFRYGKLRKFKAEGRTVKPTQFVDSFLDDKLEEYFNSQSIPVQYTDVQVMVRENFEKVVKDEEKHVLAGFFSDTCSYCAELHESFDRAKKELMSGNEDIKFAKLNLDRNDVDVEVKGMPAIFLYKKGEKNKPIEFPLIRDWEVILTWLETQLDRKDIYKRPMPEELKPKGPQGFETVPEEEMEEL